MPIWRIISESSAQAQPAIGCECGPPRCRVRQIRRRLIDQVYGKHRHPAVTLSPTPVAFIPVEALGSCWRQRLRAQAGARACVSCDRPQRHRQRRFPADGTALARDFGKQRHLFKSAGVNAACTTPGSVADLLRLHALEYDRVQQRPRPGV